MILGAIAIEEVLSNSQLILFFAYLLIGIFTFSILKTLFDKIFRMEEYRHKIRRENEMLFKEENDEVSKSHGVIEKICAPFMAYYNALTGGNDSVSISNKLKLSGWDKYFTVAQWRIFTVIIRIVSIILLLVLGFFGWWIPGIIIVALAFFLPGFGLTATAKDNERLIIAGFPQFIRVMTGFLDGTPFAIAVERTIPHVNSVWKRALTHFIAKLETSGETYEALDWLKHEMPSQVVISFVDIAKDTVELGGSVQEAFASQVEDVEQLMATVINDTIGRRENLTLITSVLLLLAVLAVVAYPSVVTLMGIL